jgi:signal transduction histidine kinase
MDSGLRAPNRVWSKLLGLVVLLYALSINCFGQRLANWRLYKAADGLSESYTATVTAGPSGVIWSKHGEAELISVLTGFEVVHHPSPGPGHCRIYESRAGQIWSLYAGGIKEFKDGQWAPYPVAEIQTELETKLLLQVRPFPMLPGERDKVIFLLPDRLMQFDSVRQKTSVIWPAQESRLDKFVDMSEARDGGVWLSASRGLAKLPGPTRSWTTNFVRQEFLVPEHLQIHNLQRPVEDDEGGVTAVAESRLKNERVLVYFDGQSWQTQPVLGGKVRLGWRGPDGTFWALSINALVHFDWGNPEMPEKEALPAGQFLDAAVEPKGVFWLATSEGLMRYAPLPWRMPRQVAAVNPLVHAICEDAEHRLWFAGATALILCHNGRWRVFDYPAQWELEFQATDTLFALPDGRLAINATDRLFLFHPGLEQFELVKHPLGRPMKLIGQFRRGALCLQTFDPEKPRTSYHLEKYDGSAFEVFMEPQAHWTLGNELFFCAQSGRGDLPDEFWLGGNTGIGWFHENKLQTFSRADGAPPEGAFCFLELSEGRVWCGGQGRIYEFDGKYWSVLRTGLDRVNAMVKGRDGVIWVASSDGLYRYVRGSWIQNGVDEGLPSVAVYEAFVDHQGNLWAGTARGLSRYDPSADIDPPKTAVTSASGADEFSLDTLITLVFSGRDRWKFTPADRLLYAYRLDNLKWSPYQSDNAVAFKELTPGKHNLEVRAMDRNGNEDPQPAIFEFTVILPWYLETRLLITLFGGLATAVFFAGLAINRHMQLKRSYAEVERIVEQRTRELQEANQALLHSQKMRALGTLAAGIAHDFNSILSIIKGSAQIIEDNLDERKKVLTRLDRIKTVVDQATGIIKMLLGFSRLSDQELVTVEVNVIVEDTLRLLGDRFLSETTLRCETGQGLPPVPCAKDLLQQMLLNLILNAAEAMTSRGQVTVRTGLLEQLPAGLVLGPAPATRYVYIAVQDTGCGIAPEVQARIFEPFFTTKSFSSRRGTGLGLSMVYEFAKDQGYGLRVESVVGKGSTFTILMPVKDGGAVLA